MKKLIACGLLVLGAFPAMAADVTIPIDSYKLKNGLRVILSRDNAVPVVTAGTSANVIACGFPSLRRMGIKK